MVVNSSTFISDATLLLRDILANGITDPIAAKRASTDARFVATTFQKKNVRYPLIYVKSVGPYTNQRLGAGSQYQWMNMPFEIRIFALDEKTRDNLTEQVINFLRSNQNSGQSTTTSGLHDFEISSNVPVDEDGENGVKSQVIQVLYKFVLGA